MKVKTETITLIILILVNFLILSIFISNKYNNKPPIRPIKQEIIDSTDYYACISHIKKYDTFESKAYKEKGKWYVGYGFLTNDSLATISKKNADKKLIELFNLEVEFARELYKLSDNKCYAIGLLSYRWGRRNVVTSELHNEILANNPVGIFKEWSEINKFNKKPHIKVNERCEFEINMFFKY